MSTTTTADGTVVDNVTGEVLGLRGTVEQLPPPDDVLPKDGSSVPAATTAQLDQARGLPTPEAETQTPAPAPAPAPAPDGPSVPVTPAQPGQEPTGDVLVAPPAVTGPEQDVDRALDRARAAEEPRVAREDAAPRAGKPSRYMILYAILALSDRSTEAEPVVWRVWTGPKDGVPVAEIVEAHTQADAKRHVLTTDERLAVAMVDEVLWLACVPVNSWKPSRPRVVPVTAAHRVEV